MKKMFTVAGVALAVSLVLSACGGGGGSSGSSGSSGSTVVTPPPPVTTPPTAPVLTGRWVNDQGVWVARWLAPAQGESASPVWLLSNDGKSLAYLTADVSTSGAVSAIGQAFNLDPQAPTVTAVHWTGTYDAKTSKVLFADGSSMTQDAPQSAAIQSEVTGSWDSSLGAALIDLSFTIDSQGVLTGASTTGCTYAGVVLVRTGSFVYDARVTEACPDKTQVLLNGIASLSATKQNLSFTLMTADRQNAKALFFSKH